MHKICRSSPSADRVDRKPRPRRRFSSAAGQSLVEVALVTAFILLPLAVGVIDFGRYMHIAILVGNAARAGAAYGALAPGDTTGIQTAACNDFLNNLGSTPPATCNGSATASNPNNLNDLQVTSWQTCGCDQAGTIATLQTGGAYCDAVPDADMAACVPPDGTGHWTSMVNVTASGTFNAFGLQLFNVSLPGTITISRTATIRVSQ